MILIDYVTVAQVTYISSFQHADNKKAIFWTHVRNDWFILSIDFGDVLRLDLRAKEQTQHCTFRPTTKNVSKNINGATSTIKLSVILNGYVYNNNIYWDVCTVCSIDISKSHCHCRWITKMERIQFNPQENTVQHISARWEHKQNRTHIKSDEKKAKIKTASTIRWTKAITMIQLFYALIS